MVLTRIDGATVDEIAIKTSYKEGWRDGVESFKNFIDSLEFNGDPNED